MRKIRLTIDEILTIVLVLPIGFVAFKNANATSAAEMELLTCGLLGIAIIGAILRRGAERAWWIGFAVFGSGYLSLAFWSWSANDRPVLPTLTLLEAIDPRFALIPPPDVGVICTFGGIPKVYDPSYVQLGHCLWTSLAALLGGTLARAIFGPPAGRTTQPNGKRRLWPTIFALTGLDLVASTAILQSSWDSSLWTGAMFLLTWALVGLLGVGAILDRGSAGRSAWAPPCLARAIWFWRFIVLPVSRQGPISISPLIGS